MLKHKSSRRKQIRMPSKKIPKQLRLYQFPVVEGLEDVTKKLNAHPAENIFGALHHAFALQQITSEESATAGERMLEYLGRAFEEMPLEVQHYSYILELLLKEYDASSHVQASQTLAPHLFLKALLEEDGLSQKNLVPDCFHTESQVSEFLHQKKGRSKLSYAQAKSLGKKFHVDPLSFMD